MHLNKSIIAGIILVAFSVVALVYIIPSQILTSKTYAQEMSPRFFPNLGMAILLALSLLLIVTKRKTPSEKDDVEPLNREQVFRVVGTAIIMGLAVFLMETFGYFICTTGAMIGLMLYLGSRNWKVIFIAAIVLSTFIYLLFEKGLNLEFPRGMLF